MVHIELYCINRRYGINCIQSRNINGKQVCTINTVEITYEGLEKKVLISSPEKYKLFSCDTFANYRRDYQCCSDIYTGRFEK